MMARLRNHVVESIDVMDIISNACREIIRDYPSGHTECVYEKLLSQYLYERCIPFVTQVDCFIQMRDTQVHIGRIDMEVAHNTVLELKVGAGVRQQDLAQLSKYVRAKRQCGMTIKNAAVICFRTDNQVEIVKLLTSGPSA